MVFSKVALTGASGMVGRHVISILKERNITCIGSSRTRVEGVIPYLVWKPWDLKDWKSPSEIDELFGDVNAILHVGAIVPKGSQATDDNLILDANVRSCLCIAKWALEKNIPVLFLSGSTVYVNQEHIGIKETDPVAVNNLVGGFYGFSKLLAEQIFQYFECHGLEICILRPSSIYGDGLASTKMITKFLAQAHRNEVIRLSPPITDRVDLVHASDVATAILDALENQARGVFNIACGKQYTIEEIAKTCVQAVGRGSVEISEKGEDKKPSTRFALNTEQAQKTFNYSPQFTLAAGIKKMWQDIQKYPSFSTKS